MCRNYSQRPGEDLPDDCKLYVGNLALSMTDSLLRQTFEQFGRVTHAVVLKDIHTGQSRGYGFVHMGDTITASNAARGMHGQVRPRL